MIRKAATATAFLVLCSFSPPSAAQGTAKNEEQPFRKLEKSMFDAFLQFVKGNSAPWAVLDDQYWTINADGSTGGEEASLSRQMSAWAAALNRIEASEFLLRRFGNVAVITGRSKYFSADGKLLGEVRHTEIWVHRKDGWKFAGWQGTLLPPKS